MDDIAFLDDNPDKAKAHPVIGTMKDIRKRKRRCEEFFGKAKQMSVAEREAALWELFEYMQVSRPAKSEKTVSH